MSTLQIVFLLLAASLILFWLLMAARGPRRLTLPHVHAILRYGPAARLLALLVALAPPTLMAYFVASLAWRSQTTLAIAGASFLLTGLIAGLLLLEVAGTQILLTEEGITRTAFWSGTTTLPWSEIERIRYSTANRWFIVSGANRTITVSRHLQGTRPFAEMVRRKVAPERYASAASVLDALA